jgi:hypothetical protein
MLSRLSKCLACAIALLTVVSAGNAFAQHPLDKRTLFTFGAPVRLPGVTLPPGRYLFRLADVNSQSVVQVLNTDGTKLFGTFFTIPAVRPTAAEAPEVHFMETQATAPRPVRTWWYPGEPTGFEFIYSKREARRLAETAHQPVLTTQGQTVTTTEANTKDLSRISSSGSEAKVDSKAAPVSAAPTGDTQSGTVAPPSMVMPAHPTEVETDSEQK